MSMEGPQHEGQRPDFEEPADNLNMRWGGEEPIHSVDSHEIGGLPTIEDLKSDEGITRGEFLTGLAIIGGVIAAGVVEKIGLEKVAEQKAETEEQFISKMEENTITVNTGADKRLWDLYEESGYYDLGIPEAEAYFYKAVEELNPDKAEQIKRRVVNPNETLVIPVTGEKSD